MAALCAIPLLLRADDGAIAGKWQMTVQSPHGPVTGPLQLKQEGSKFNGTYETQMFGKMQVAGTLDGRGISFTLQMPSGDMTFKFTGTVEGSKMSGTYEPQGAAWSATRDQTVLGTVIQFKIPTLEIGVRPDHGDPVFLKFGPQTQVLCVAAGETNLERAQPASMTDISPGDRVMVSFVTGLAEARRIVLVSSTDIARRNETVRQEWRTRGVSGIVISKTAEEVVIEQRPRTITVAVKSKTKLRRYAPDSVKFADAQPGTLDEIAIGDQLQARGSRSDDGTRVAADEIVFGTFLTKIGTVTAIRPEAGEIDIRDLAAKAPVTVRLTADSRIKMLPDMQHMMSSPQHEAPDTRTAIANVIEHLPPAAIGDLKVGSAIVVTSTRGASPDRITAITVLANADALIQVATAHSGGGDPMEAMSRMHGGALNGPTGVSLPAIIQ